MSRETPPAALDDRLDALAARVRRQRIRFYFSVWVLVSSLLVLLGVLLDSIFSLSVAVRSFAFVAWLLYVGTIAWRLLRIWALDPPVEEVAERMMADDSPNVVAAIAREEKDHRIYPAWPSAACVTTAMLASLAVFMVAVTSGERVRRLALPWHTRSAIAPFDIIVVSGDAVARRGEPITLTAYLRPRDPNGRLPRSATLRLRDSEVEMNGAKGAFHATLPAAEADFEYRVEAGSTASEWFTVRIADSVELTPESLIVLTPPEYLANQVKPWGSPFAEFEAIQFSTASLHLKFNRAAESAAIEWRPDGRNPFEAPDVIPMSLAADRRSGTASLPLKTNGMLRAVLVNESGPRRLRTETAIGVRVRTDRPPRFERLEGMAAQPRTARPGQELRILFTATDDFGIASATLESEHGSAPILLESNGASRTDGLAVIRAPAKEGETLRFRLRLRDSRRVPSENLTTQEIVFPPAGWFEVKASASGPPFQEQQILGQRDAVNAVLAAAKERLAAWTTEVEALRRELEALQAVPLDHVIRLATIREQIRDTRTGMERAAADARLTSELGALADRLSAFADGELLQVDDAFEQAEGGSSGVLKMFLKIGTQRLEQARAAADRNVEANNRFAQHRLDRARLLALADSQHVMANSDLTPDGLARIQRDFLLVRLKQIVSDSEPLTRATTALAANESARLATEARRLAVRIRELDEAASQLHASLRQDLLAEHAALQAELVKRIDEVAKQLDAPVRLAALAKPKREEFERVGELLRLDKTVDALTELERLAAALDKLAGECDSWAADRTDAKLAAAQYAKWQTDLRARFLADPKTAPAAEQRALVEAAERLRVPAGESATLRDAALVHSRLALRRLELANPEAEIAVRLAAQSFERLATAVPSLADRHKRALGEIDKVLRPEQKYITDSTETVIRQFDKLPLTSAVMQNIAVKLGPLQTRQAKLADRVAALDVPRHEGRQARVVQAAKAAAADLKDGLPLDCIASLGACHRELDRLKQALEGQVPVDVRVADLAEKQAEALRLALTAGENAPEKSWQPVVTLQLQVANGVGREEFAAPEAPGLLAEARRTVEAAELSLRDGSNFETIVRRLRDAKEALALFADRVNDRETEKDRVSRFVAMRRTAECNAKRLAGRMANPDASAAAKAELDREFTELAMTRVGAPAQAAKRKAVELHFRLQNRPEPDRQAADQKQVADALAEVAALMAGEARLTTRPDLEPPTGDPAGEYLPSAKHAAALRELAKRERELRERLNGLPKVVAERMKPAAINPFAPLEVKQRSFAESLRAAADGSFWKRVKAAQAAAAAHRAADRLAVGDRAGALAAIDEAAGSDSQNAIRDEAAKVEANSNAVAAQHLARHAALAGQATELARQIGSAVADGDLSLAEAGERVRNAERSLAAAAGKDFADAARLRSEAITSFKPIRPDPDVHEVSPTDAAGLAVREAERAMARALRELGSKGDPKDAMRRAEAALREAAAAIPRQ